MNIRYTLFILIITVITFSAIQNYTFVYSQDLTVADSLIPKGLKSLLKSYPDFLDSAGINQLYWKDGFEMIYDDGITGKTHDEMLDNPDLEDMMIQKYEKGSDWDYPPDVNFEPGRIRFEPFFYKMYGSSEDEVMNNLVNVEWIDGSIIQFSSVNGADEKLRSVIRELKELPSEFRKYLKNIGGTFNWRVIAGTNRLSTHSFGIAIDINTKYSDYWKWNNNTEYINRIPVEIAEVFEKYGFIWGGKWYHYDTMHFEYRPELLTD